MRSVAAEGTAHGADEDRPSVLHVSQPGSEGVANYLRELSVRQVERGWRVGVACPPHSRLAISARNAGLAVLPWQAERHPGPGLIREVRDLAAAINRFEPSIVHLHSSKAGMVGRLAVRRRRPTVFQPHAWSFDAVAGPFDSLAMVWERSAARWADAIITVSLGEKATADENGIRSAGVDVTIPNPVDTELFRPAGSDAEETRRLRRSLGLATQPLVACLGRLCHQKGQDLLLEAWPAVAAAVPDAQLLLIGDGPSRSALERSAGDEVHFLGDRADVPELLRAVQVVALPSRWEGMSLAMLEAMASAKPVVVTDVGGAAETAGRGAGAVVPIGDLDRLAEEIVRRLNDEDLAGRDGERGRNLVAQRHTITAVVDSTDEVYRAVLGLRHADRPVSPPLPATARPAEPADV